MTQFRCPWTTNGSLANVEQAIYDFAGRNIEYELTHYRDILERNEPQWGSVGNVQGRRVSFAARR